MKNTWFFVFASWSALASLTLLSASPALADCGSTTTTTSPPAYSYAAPAAYPSYTAPAYAPYPAYAYPPPMYAYPPPPYAPYPPVSAGYGGLPYAYSGYYGTPYPYLTGSPYFDSAFGVTTAALFRPYVYPTVYPGYVPAYAPPITTAAAFYPNIPAAPTVINVTHVSRTIVVARGPVARHPIARPPIARPVPLPAHTTIARAAFHARTAAFPARTAAFPAQRSMIRTRVVTARTFPMRALGPPRMMPMMIGRRPPQ